MPSKLDFEFENEAKTDINRERMLDMKLLGGLHEVAIGVTDNKSIKIFGLEPQTRVATSAFLPRPQRGPPKIFEI